MRTYTSYDDLAWTSAAPPGPVLLEGWSPPAIQRWADMTRFKLKEMIAKAEADRTPEYVKLLMDFDNGWSAWTKDGMAGDMDIDALKKEREKSELLADMNWPYASFFQGLFASLGELMSYQSTRNTVPENPEQNMPRVGGAGLSLPPLTPEFGPQEKKPTSLKEPAPAEGGAETPPGGVPEPELPALPGEKGPTRI